MAALRRVEKLSVTFLVDNNLEWFTKLPPGFTHELRLQLSQDPPIDPLTGVPILDLENYCCAAHGFSALIETQLEGDNTTHYTVFDAGPDSRSIARNVAALKIPIEKVDRLILSHWHSDHSGGIPSFLRIRKEAVAKLPKARPCIVDLHWDRPIARGISPQPGFVVGRLPEDPTFEEVEKLGGVVEKHSEGHAVAGDTVWVSGEIPRKTEYEQGILGAVRWVHDEAKGGGYWVPEEHVMDERYAAVDVMGKGLVIFSSCSHAGIVNVATHAAETFKRPIHMIIGGLHLAGPELAYRIEPTVDFFANKMKPSPTYILPMHCSGFPVKVALEHALGEGCVPAGAGIKIEVAGDKEAEGRIFPPVIS